VSEDVQVGWETGEHRAGFAGFHIEDEFLVHFLGVHGLEGVKELISVKEVINDSNEAGGSVISEVDEDVVVSGTLKDLLPLGCGGVTSENSEEVVSSDIIALIVDNTASIDVVTVWLVENFSWERILRVVGNIIDIHGDIVVRVNTVTYENLIRVADIVLVAVVVIVVGSGQ
jgi:hypothetical protein